MLPLLSCTHGREREPFLPPSSISLPLLPMLQHNFPQSYYRDSATSLPTFWQHPSTSLPPLQLFDSSRSTLFCQGITLNQDSLQAAFNHLRFRPRPLPNSPCQPLYTGLWEAWLIVGWWWCTSGSYSTNLISLQQSEKQAPTTCPDPCKQMIKKKTTSYDFAEPLVI